MALLPQDQQSKVMLLITIGMVGLGWGFWTYWEQPTGQQIDTARVEIDSLQRIVDRAKQDLASGTVEDLRRKVEEYTSLLSARSSRRRHRRPRRPGRSRRRGRPPSRAEVDASERAQRGAAGGTGRGGAAGGAGEAQARREARQRQGRCRQSGQHGAAGAGAGGLLVRGRRARSVPVAAHVGGHPAALVGPEARRDLLRRPVHGAQRRGAARRDQQQDLPGEAR